MNIEVISTGTELLSGSAVNSDLAIMGRLFRAAAYQIGYAHTVGDDRTALIEALATAAKRADVILLTGGLGSTRDDITRAVTAEFFGRELTRDESFGSYLRYLWRVRRGAGRIPGDYFRQAERIGGAEFLKNENGTAPGQYFTCCYAAKERHIFLLPGPPLELEPMVKRELMPRMEKLHGDAQQYCSGCLIAGQGELELQAKLEPMLKNFELEIAYCASPEGTRCFLSGRKDIVSQALKEVQRNFAGQALPEGRFDLSEELVHLLTDRNWKLGLAESCTGGMIAAGITDVAGSSAIFEGGIVSYSNAVKQQLLGVSDAILSEHGAVSAPCAAAMAMGAKRALNVDIAGSVTGIAGPGGGTEEKPVGTVFMAIAMPDGKIEVTEHHFRGDRQTVRIRTKATLLLKLYEAVRTIKSLS